MAKDITNISVFGNPYKSLEDQVTAALLQLVALKGNDLVAHLFDECDFPDFQPSVRTQVSSSTSSRPDGEIICTCVYHILIEAKIVKNALRRQHDQQQLAKHIAHVHAEGGINLIYITPDDACPPELKAHPEVIWCSWEEIVARLESFDQADAVYIFLVEQFKKLLRTALQHFEPKHHVHVTNDDKDEELTDGISPEERVMIVGGRWAEDVALTYGFYACQSHRYFHKCKYLAFYFNNRIAHLFEIVGDPIEEVDLKTLPAVASTDYLTVKDPTYTGTRKYFKLEVIKSFNPEIANASFTLSGRRVPFVQRQRYTTYTKIMNAKTTNDLL